MDAVVGHEQQDLEHAAPAAAHRGVDVADDVRVTAEAGLCAKPGKGIRSAGRLCKGVEIPWQGYNKTRECTGVGNIGTWR